MLDSDLLAATNHEMRVSMDASAPLLFTEPDGEGFRDECLECSDARVAVDRNINNR